MPNTLIETRAGWVKDPHEIIDAVQNAMLDGFKIAEHDRTIRLIEHKATHFEVPPDAGEKYTIVESKVLSGRSLDCKRAVYKAIVTNLEKLGVPVGDIKIALVEVPPEDWGVHGGEALIDVMQISKV